MDRFDVVYVMDMAVIIMAVVAVVLWLVVTILRSLK